MLFLNKIYSNSKALVKTFPMSIFICNQSFNNSKSQCTSLSSIQPIYFQKINYNKNDNIVFEKNVYKHLYKMIKQQPQKKYNDQPLKIIYGFDCISNVHVPSNTRPEMFLKRNYIQKSCMTIAIAEL